MAPLVCGNCLAPIPEGIHPYTMRIELFPRVEESTQISEEDMEIDLDAEIKKTIAQLEAMSEEERTLEEERVFSSFSFALCGACRDLLAQQLRRNRLRTR